MSLSSIILPRAFTITKHVIKASMNFKLTSVRAHLRKLNVCQELLDAKYPWKHKTKNMHLKQHRTHKLWYNKIHKCLKKQVKSNTHCHLKKTKKENACSKYLDWYWINQDDDIPHVSMSLPVCCRDSDLQATLSGLTSLWLSARRKRSHLC